MKSKKIILIITIIIEILFCLDNISLAKQEENSIDTSQIIELQKDSLKINDFIDEAKEYSTEILDDIDMQKLFEGAISGNIKTNSFGKKILKKLFGELMNAIEMLVVVLVIIFIHSIIKCVSDSLENNSASKVAYYVSYILIISTIIKNFTDIIIMIKKSIETLVTFVNCLLPILLSLLVASGGITSAATLQSIILVVLTIISNIATKIIIPFSLITIALNIISNISDKVQISKLAKYINSSTIWVLGILLTIFVGITSLEGTMSKRYR